MNPEPFAYSSSAHVRKHGPYGYRSYDSYRPWLRDEFRFRCVFCLYREQWPSARGWKWHVNHLRSRTDAPELTLDYDNLFYLCATCNGNKSAAVVSDPCKVPLGKCIRVAGDGSISARNRTGRLLIRTLRLDNDDYTRMRGLIIGILRTLYVNGWVHFASMMSFPNDLPDLASLRPAGNTRPAGVEKSFHSLRAKGECPTLY